MEKNNKQNHQEVDSSRRKFLRNTGIATGGVLGGAILGGLLGNPFKSEDTTTSTPPPEVQITNHTEARQFFNRQEDFDVLSTATELIFPEDEHGPGAIGLGVPYFIDKQLAGAWGQNTKAYMKAPFQDGETPLNRGEVYITGIRTMNEISKSEYGNAFPRLEEEQQIEILQSFENGEVKMNKVDSSHFFALLRQNTLEGVYSDPVHGGNKNMEGWKMKEYPGVRMSYRDVVEEEDFVLFEPQSLSDI